jgi:hypothetical protein
MLVTVLYGKCKELGYCLCEGENGCGVENDKTMYVCEKCGRSHFRDDDPHKRGPKPRPTASEVANVPGAKEIANRAERLTKYDGSPEAFVRAYMEAWQQGQSVHDLAKLFDITPKSVSSKAGKFRRMGVKLPNLRPRVNINVKALNAIVSQYQ